MNKIYIGDNEIFNGVNDSSFVDVSTFDEHEKVIATAITYIDASVKALDASINALAQGGGSFDPTDINSSISDISTRVHNIESDYVVADDLSTFLTEDDISTFITQTTLDASYGVLDASVKALDASVRTLDLTNYYTKSQSDSSLINYTYSKSHIDASISSITPSFVVMSEADYELITPNSSTLYFLT